jgi:hypothetical protein
VHHLRTIPFCRRGSGPQNGGFAKPPRTQQKESPVFQNRTLYIAQFLFAIHDLSGLKFSAVLKGITHILHR